uniref:Uncharacterized protein n=1 Tax=Siphoviridae sp. ctcx61 TaxID=2825575 RepID=A0A8S5TWP0_9CAUD|nr:MAG TPA: hypothetical protein [Siphoviridae sp. ctcx61]
MVIKITLKNNLKNLLRLGNWSFFIVFYLLDIKEIRLIVYI